MEKQYFHVVLARRRRENFVILGAFLKGETVFLCSFSAPQARKKLGFRCISIAEIQYFEGSLSTKMPPPSGPGG